MKNEKGVAAIIWILGVILLIAIIVFAVNLLQNGLEQKNVEDIKTEMLKIQAKAKVVLEMYHVDNKNTLKGEKMSDASLEGVFGITEIANYYKWTIDTLKEVGIQNTLLQNDDYYLVNYDNEEVVYSLGYIAENGNVYYKLSDIKEF